jgi:hypothetical protein
MIVSLDEGNNVSSERCDAAINAAADFPFGKERKEALNLIEPGRTGRRQMNMPARPLGQLASDQRRLVGGVIVPDEMDIETLRNVGFDLVEELSELSRAMPAIALPDHVVPDHVAGGDIEGCIRHK